MCGEPDSNRQPPKLWVLCHLSYHRRRRVRTPTAELVGTGDLLWAQGSNLHTRINSPPLCLLS